MNSEGGMRKVELLRTENRSQMTDNGYRQAGAERLRRSEGEKVVGLGRSRKVEFIEVGRRKWEIKDYGNRKVEGNEFGRWKVEIMAIKFRSLVANNCLDDANVHNDPNEHNDQNHLNDMNELIQTSNLKK